MPFGYHFWRSEVGQMVLPERIELSTSPLPKRPSALKPREFGWIVARNRLFF